MFYVLVSTSTLQNTFSLPLNCDCNSCFVPGRSSGHISRSLPEEMRIYIKTTNIYIKEPKKMKIKKLQENLTVCMLVVFVLKKFTPICKQTWTLTFQSRKLRNLKVQEKVQV